MGNEKIAMGSQIKVAKKFVRYANVLESAKTRKQRTCEKDIDMGCVSPTQTKRRSEEMSMLPENHLARMLDSQVVDGKSSDQEKERARTLVYASLIGQLRLTNFALRQVHTEADVEEMLPSMAMVAAQVAMKGLDGGGPSDPRIPPQMPTLQVGGVLSPVGEEKKGVKKEEESEYASQSPPSGIPSPTVAATAGACQLISFADAAVEHHKEIKRELQAGVKAARHAFEDLLQQLVVCTTGSFGTHRVKFGVKGEGFGFSFHLDVPGDPTGNISAAVYRLRNGEYREAKGVAESQSDSSYDRIPRERKNMNDDDGYSSDQTVGKRRRRTHKRSGRRRR